MQHLNIELTDISEGSASAKIKIQQHHRNLHGGMHGGCVFSLADTVAGYTAMSLGTVVTTLNASFNYLRPAINTEYVYCKGEVVKSGKTVIVVRTLLSDDSGRLIADGSFSCFVLRDRENS